MLNPKRHTSFPIVNHAKIGSSIFGLIVLAIASAPSQALFTGCEAHRVTQPMTVPVKYENDFLPQIYFSVWVTPSSASSFRNCSADLKWIAPKPSSPAADTFAAESSM
jgi:hypothetical protein